MPAKLTIPTPFNFTGNDNEGKERGYIIIVIIIIWLYGVSPTSNMNCACGTISRASTQMKAASSLLRLPFSAQPCHEELWIVGTRVQIHYKEIYLCKLHLLNNQILATMHLGITFITGLFFMRTEEKKILKVPFQSWNLVFHQEYFATCQLWWWCKEFRSPQVLLHLAQPIFLRCYSWELECHHYLYKQITVTLLNLNLQIAAICFGTCLPERRRAG